MARPRDPGALMRALADRTVVLGSALTVALFAVAHASTRQVETREHADQLDAVLDQVQFPAPDPIALIEVDQLGNILIPVQADALVTHDGATDTGPMIAGMDIRGSRCARSVESAMSRTGGPFTVVCLPREYGLYERMNGRPAPSPDEPLEE